MTDTNSKTAQLAQGTQKPQINTPNEINPIHEAHTAIDLELKQIALATAREELEEKRLTNLLHKASLEDSQDVLATRELKRQQTGQRARGNGIILNDIRRVATATQARCTHRKGGNGLAGFVGGQGQDSNYAILTHTFANGDIEVWCMRCKKKWKKPIQAHHDSPESYNAAVEEYRRALNFPTDNSPSTSVPFRFSDNGEYYRERTWDS